MTIINFKKYLVHKLKGCLIILKNVDAKINIYKKRIIPKAGEGPNEI